MVDSMTYEQAARIMREATKDKSYQLTPIGQEVAAYLRQKRKRLTASSYRNYEGILDKLARDFPDLELADFEPPAGTELVERFMEDRYGTGSPRAYNRNLSIVRDFFRWAQVRAKMKGDPTMAIERAKPEQTYRTTFTEDQLEAMIASSPSRRDRIALRLLLHYAIRKGALKAIQFKHFDHQRRQLTIFTKGRKVRRLPIPQSEFWTDLEFLILDFEAQPDHFLMHRRKLVPAGSPRPDGTRDTKWVFFPDKPMSDHALHDWWYARLAEAGIVPEGTTRGERMHKARHTAGQRVLDRTQNIRAVQALLGHASIATTADVYTDWDLDQLAGTMKLVLGDDA